MMRRLLQVATVRVGGSSRMIAAGAWAACPVLPGQVGVARRQCHLTEAVKLPASDAAADDHYGHSVSVNGDLLGDDQTGGSNNENSLQVVTGSGTGATANQPGGDVRGGCVERRPHRKTSKEAVS